MMPLRHSRLAAPALPRSPHPRAVVLLGGALLWTGFVLAFYYTQLWNLVLHPSIPLFSLPVLPRFPYWRLALAHNLASGLASGLVILSAGLLGRWLLGRIKVPIPSLRARAAFAVSLGLGAFAYLGLGLALLGLYRPWILRLAAAVPIFLALPALGRWVLSRATQSLLNPIREFRSRGSSWIRLKAGPHFSDRTITTPARKGLGSFPGRLWMGLALLAAGLAFFAALAPEHEYDALWYHLAYPQRFLQAGRLVDLPGDYVSLYPMTWELWFGYGLAAGGAFAGQTAATLLHFACLPLTGLLVYDLSRRAAPAVSPWLSVALFAAIPTVLWEASTAYIDLALAFHVTLTLYALLAYLHTRRTTWLVLAGLNLGLALGTKHLALFVLGLACLGLVFGLAIQDRRLSTGWKPEVFLAGLRPAVFLAGLRPAVFLAGLAVLLASPWYLRSWLASGNPFFPELYAVFGAPAARWNPQTEAGLKAFLNHFGPPRTLENLLTLPWHMTVHAAAYDGSLGPLFLVLLPILGLRMRNRTLRWLAVFTLGYLLLWASPLSSFQMRFLVPITPCLAVLGAAAFAHLAGLARLALRRRPVWLAGALSLLLLLNLPFFTALHEHDRVGWNGWLNSVLHGLPWQVVLGAESRSAYLARTVYSYGVWSFANQALPPSARVLTWSSGDQFYARRSGLWAYSAQAAPVAWARRGQEARALEGLRALGISALIVPQPGNPQVQIQDSELALLSPAALSAWYEPLYSDSRYALYRIRWETLPTTPAGASPAAPSDLPLRSLP